MNTKQSLDEFRKEIKNEQVELTKKIAKIGFEKLIQYSPYKRGSYILSHRIGIGSADLSFTLIPETPQDKNKKTAGAEAGRGAAEQTAKTRELRKLEDLKPFQTVLLSNSVGHALAIEFGWSKQAPSGVYSLVKVELESIL